MPTATQLFTNIQTFIQSMSTVISYILTMVGFVATAKGVYMFYQGKQGRQDTGEGKHAWYWIVGGGLMMSIPMILNASGSILSGGSATTNTTVNSIFGSGSGTGP